MKNIGLMLVLFFCSFSSKAFDKYDAMVCEASANDLTRIQCYRNTGVSNECHNKQASEELACYRGITKKLENIEEASSHSDLVNAQASKIDIEPSSEIPIPRSMAGDKGKYFLLNSKKNGDIVKALHKRVGVDSVGFTLTETDCSTMKMREIGYSEESPSKIKENPTDWFDLVSGSSKSDLAKFVCKE